MIYYDTVEIGYNDLGYNDLGYNDLGYNDLGYNDKSSLATQFCCPSRLASPFCTLQIGTTSKITTDRIY